MSKHIGITSNPERRKKEHEDEYPTLHNWVIIRQYLNYREAQEVEMEFINLGYEGHPGGQKTEGNVYSVYTFKT